MNALQPRTTALKWNVSLTAAKRQVATSKVLSPTFHFSPWSETDFLVRNVPPHANGNEVILINYAKAKKSYQTATGN